VASDAGVKELILFHHDPGHDDSLLTQVQSEARTFFEHTWAAREGRVIEYGCRPRIPAPRAHR
jgi:ribonuclease BN (tRNA processing enzyme)